MSWIRNLTSPQWLVYDNNNNILYVSNRISGTISKICVSTGNVEQNWIYGLTSPYGLAIHNNYLYMADMMSSSILQIDMEKGIINNKTWAVIEPYFPKHLCINNNIMYVSCPNSNTICKIQIDNDSNASIIEKEWISKSSGLRTPNGITCDNNGYLYVSNYDNNTISKINMTTSEIEVYWVSSNLLDQPTGMCVFNNFIYIVNERCGSLCQINIDSKVVTNSVWASNMCNPISVIHDTVNTIYISSNGDQSIYRYNIINDVVEMYTENRKVLEEMQIPNKIKVPNMIQNNLSSIYREIADVAPNSLDISISSEKTLEKLNLIQEQLNLIYEKLNIMNQSSSEIKSEKEIENNQEKDSQKKIEKSQSKSIVTIKKNLPHNKPLMDLKVNNIYPHKGHFTNKHIKLTYKIVKL
uniref:SMP-30/Gluconolactonase/LRE-like region domain-containing protein n=1 Tax=viral metagenome TaxID=1070528 RepID=A0A6C0B0Z3_9ZZZZ